MFRGAAVSRWQSKYDWRRILCLSVGFGAIGLTLWLGEPLTADNAAALQILVTAFSILAGVPIAILALLGNPSGLYGGSWRVASAHRRQVRRRLYRYALLFWIYLVAIGLAYASALLGGTGALPGLAHWIERAALSAGVGAFVWSLGLPGIVVRIHMERLDEAVSERRASDRE